MNLSSSKRNRRWAKLAIAAGLASALALTACSGGIGGGSNVQTVSQADIDKAMQTPTTLTFWTWVPDIADEVKLFTDKYPAIKIDIVNAGQGTPQYTKLRTALKAGTGAPDVAQIEFQYIPTFTLTGDLVDLRPYGASAVMDKFVDWTKQQVTGPNGEIWAYPQDTGPMGLLYRTDMFEKYGVDVPKTWDDFAVAAKKIHDADPNVYITNIAPGQAGVWHGLMWQAGEKMFGYTGGQDISLKTNTDGAKKIGKYWEDLIKQGLVSTDPDFTDDWYQGLNKGKYASWITAAWGPVFLQGSAKDTSGKWRAAPLPQWDAGKPSAGNWGGSTSAVIKGTKNPIAAAKFAEFLNADPASAKMFATKQFFFPATKGVLADADFVGQKPEFYGGQEVNKLFSDISNTVNVAFQWPPFLDQVNTDFNETVGKALADKTDVAAALDAWQDRIVTYAKNQGFTVK